MKNRAKKAEDFDFQSQIKEFANADTYSVEAQCFEKYWRNGWICYIDLLAFSESCKKSNQSTINSIVRFHRIINSARKKVKGVVYQFTDCCFFISNEFEATLTFALYVINGCCAMNEITFAQKALVKAHFLLRPRISIAFGEYINSSNIKNNTLLSNINLSSFLAGSGIVYAYETEKQSFSHAIAINFLGSGLKSNDFFTVGGNSSLPKAGLERWLNLSQGDLVHFPWPYVKRLNIKQNKIHIVPNSNESFFEIERNLFKTAEKMQREFICDDTALEIAKHPMALKRFVINLYKNAKNAKQVTDSLLKELDRILSTESEVLRTFTSD